MGVRQHLPTRKHSLIKNISRPATNQLTTYSYIINRIVDKVYYQQTSLDTKTCLSTTKNSIIFSTFTSQERFLSVNNTEPVVSPTTPRALVKNPKA